MMKNKDQHPKLPYPSKAIIYNGRADKALPRQGKAKGVHHHQTLIIGTVKGTYLRKRRRSKL